MVANMQITKLIFARPIFAPRLLQVLLSVLLVGFGWGSAAKAEESVLPEVEVYLTSPLLGGVGDASRATTSVQTLDEETRSSVATDLSERLQEQIPSLNVSDVQNNPYQKDMSYRGYSSSPLLGGRQGIAVYQNGVRMNENFGDTLEWDVIPDFATDTVQLLSGANPVFGLNALGGTLALKMKDGFNFEGGQLTAQYGSFGRKDVTGEYGLTSEDGLWGGYVGSRFSQDDGWRDASPSYLRQGYASIGTKGEGYDFSFDFSHASNNLIGNGLVPADLMFIESRRAVFTSPDITKNEMFMGSLGGSYEVSDDWTLRGRAYYKDRKRPTLNGDEYDAEECTVDAIDAVCGEEEDGEEQVLFFGDGTKDVTELEDAFEENLGYEMPEEEERWGEFAAMNRSHTDSEVYGFTLQGEWQNKLSGMDNFLLAGISYDEGESDYRADTELGIFADDRSVIPFGLKPLYLGGDCEDDGGTLECEEKTYIATKLTAENTYYGIYFHDALSVNDELTLSLAGRYNRAEIDIKDASGNEPKLNGKHTFTRFNPAIGMNYKLGERASVFASYHEANRAPTAVELTCAEEEDPCRLPTSMVADPPLEQVVNRTIELGTRGSFDAEADHNVFWQAAVFGAENEDDIVFVGTGKPGTGYFKNVGKTRRIGGEISLNGFDGDGWDWRVAYSYIRATFEDKFIVDTANHPLGKKAETVRSGNDMTGIPQHQLKAGLGYMLTDSWRVGSDVFYVGEQYYRGDEANLLDELDGYWVMNAETSYRFSDVLLGFVRVNNLFNHKYESFGQLADASEVFGDDTKNPPYNLSLNDPNRFVSPGTPLMVLTGVTLNF